MSPLYTVKAAAPVSASGDPEESHAARNVAMAGAALAPFAGLIGQERLRHDPHYNRKIRRVGSNSQLARLARPGDVIVYTDGAGRDVFKAFSTTNSGSEFYHTTTVHGTRGGHPLAGVADDFEGPKAEVLRGASPERIRRNAWRLRDVLKNQGDVDAVLLRPREAMSPAQAKAFADEAARRSAQKYNMTRATGSAIKDIFLPKIKGLERRPAAPLCDGEICSSLPAQASAVAGRPHIEGKAPKDVLPSDYLRSKNFRAVAARSTAPPPTALRRAAPYLLRAGLGAGLAGTTYVASEYPEALTVPAAVAGGAALSGVLAKRLGAQTPSLLGAAVRAVDGRVDRSYAGAFAKTRLPGALLGGLAGYYGTKKLREYVRARRAERDGAVG